MIIQRFIVIACLLLSGVVLGQHTLKIEATLVPEETSLEIKQQIVYVNTSQEVLNEIYLNDWANSFATKTTPLAERFGENFNSSFHFEKKERRGNNTIYSISNASLSPLEWEYGAEIDIVKVTLDQPLEPGESYTLNALYKVKSPETRFTRYGVTDEGDFKLRYWYLSPAAYMDGQWEAYSNKNSEDLYLTPSTFDIQLRLPKNFSVTSELNEVSRQEAGDDQIVNLQGDSRMSATLYLENNNTFESIVTDKFEVITNLKDKKVTGALKALATDRIVHFLDEKLGEYPFEKMVISTADYKSSPVYGLNQLPNFISPYPNGFEHDMELLKTITRNYIENTLALHPRKDYWLIGALQIHLMIEYVDTYYPKMKIIGNLSNMWVIRWAHLADLEFNDQYPLLYMNMARNNLHQALSTPKDSLVKFNKNIASDYYAGNGLQYLSDYLGAEAVDKSIKEFYAQHRLQPVKPASFQTILESNTDLPVNWFFEDYVGKRRTIDFKIKKVKKRGDSLLVTVKNLRDTKLPVSIYGIRKDSVIYKKWLPPIDSLATFTLPAEGVKRLALNYEAVIPEFDQRNNYKAVTSLLNRPIQFRLFQDVEDPRYNQAFFMPVFTFNIYDGFVAGPKLYNKTVLPRQLIYKVAPQYGFRSKTIVGSANISYTENLDEGKLYAMRYGIAGSRFSYNEGLFFKRLTPFMRFGFRPKDLRSNKRQFINLRNVNVFRDLDPNDPDQEPNYSVFNFNYSYSNPNLINWFTAEFDYQISDRFSKMAVEMEYRKLFLNNRQLNLRLFAGTFLFNDTRSDGDFFSFALDRPTDYLFDYNYYGRSEDDGLFSQQFIVAEGGFKSQLEQAFSNSWIATLNASTNIWNWIYAYGDVGLVNNRGQGTTAVFDSGIRLSLVADYFEVFFPLYSNLGWEPGLPEYDKRIRFIVTLSPSTLLKLFTREWY